MADKYVSMLVELQSMQVRALAEANLKESQRTTKRLTSETSGLKVLEAIIDTQPPPADGKDYRNAVLLLKKLIPSHDGNLHRDIDASTAESSTVTRKTWARFVGTAITEWSGARTLTLALKDFGSPERMPKSIRNSPSFETHLGYCIRTCAAIDKVAQITGAELTDDDESSMVDLLINRWPLDILKTLDVPHHAESFATLQDLGIAYRQLRSAFKDDVDDAWRDHTDAHKGRGPQKGRNAAVVGVATDSRGSQRSTRTRRSDRSASPDREGRGRASRASDDSDRRERDSDRKDRNRRGRDHERSGTKDHRGSRGSRSRSPSRDNRRPSPPRRRFTPRGEPCRRPACQDSNVPAHTGSKCPLSLCFNCKEVGHKSFDCPRSSKKSKGQRKPF